MRSARHDHPASDDPSDRATSDDPSDGTTSDDRSDRATSDRATSGRWSRRAPRRKQSDAEVGRAFLLTGLLGLLIQVFVLAVTGHVQVALATATPFVVFACVGGGLLVKAKRAASRTA